MELMDLEKKKVDLCIEFMKLGMDLDSACVASEISPELKEKLAGDEDFVAQVNFSLARKEADLLRKLNEVAEENVKRGETKQLERLLELMNPQRYSKVTKLSHTMDNAGGTGGKITVCFEGEENNEHEA
jgi:hypothetical protein